MKNWQELLPDVLLAALVVYVCLLGFATFDEILGWGIITPFFK